MGNVKKSAAERTRHQRQYDRRVNKRQLQTQDSKIDTGKAVDKGLVVMKSNGIESKVQDDNSSILSILNPIMKGRVEPYPEKCQAKSPMLDSSSDNQTTEYSKQSLESKTIEQTTSLLANNADLKAQIQEKVFAALKTDLRKLKENSVDTKFAETSILGKLVLQSPRN
ncbi:hypothetical protein Tco_0013791 [Tanacetum coccineum]